MRKLSILIVVGFLSLLLSRCTKGADYALAARGARASVVASVVVLLASDVVELGDTTSARVEVRDAKNRLVQPRDLTWKSDDPATAAVSIQGIVSGMGQGTTEIAASADGVTGQARVFVFNSADSVTGQAIAAELPRDSVDVSWRPPSRTITVKAGENLQAALDNAKRGDEIVLEAGATFTGNFQAKPKSGTGVIIVRTSALSDLPPLGSRVSPTHADFMPKIVTPNNQYAIAVMPGASGWRFVGLEVTSTAMTVIQYRLFWVGFGDRTQKVAELAPSDIVLDRLYVHGQPTVNSAGCIVLNSAATAVIDSWISDCHGKGLDAQAIGGWNGPGPYLIENNRLEASGEHIIFGGADPAIPNLVSSDITVRRNYFTRPLEWGPPGTGLGPWTEKNLFELKNAQRVHVHSNVMENNWVDGQAGYAVMLSVVNQSGGCPWCTIQDVTFEWNHIDNSTAVFNLTQVPQYRGANGRRIKIANNLFTNIGAFPGQARVFLLQHAMPDLWIEHNTGFGPYSWMNFENVNGTEKKERFTFRNNIGGASQYNWIASQGQGDVASRGSLVLPYFITGNCIVTSNPALVPRGSRIVPSIAAVGFVNPVWPNGDWALVPGSPCTGAGVDFGILQKKLAGVR
jgi:hypothetical protein